MTNKISLFMPMFLLFIGASLLFGGYTKKTEQGINNAKLSSEKTSVVTDDLPIKAKTINDNFLGDRGLKVDEKGGELLIDEESVNDGDMHAFNYFSKKENKTIYFFVLKAPDGTYRAAANACEVCYGAKKGFSQKGDLIMCDNCRTTYPKDLIAKEKGGCNPGPINPDVSVQNKQLALDVEDIEAVAYLF
ncbi:MAG: Fe-S-containing protein [bacterium]